MAPPQQPAGPASTGYVSRLVRGAGSSLVRSPDSLAGPCNELILAAGLPHSRHSHCHGIS